jgi:hypothetical protein
LPLPSVNPENALFPAPQDDEYYPQYRIKNDEHCEKGGEYKKKGGKLQPEDPFDDICEERKHRCENGCIDVSMAVYSKGRHPFLLVYQLIGNSC